MIRTRPPTRRVAGPPSPDASHPGRRHEAKVIASVTAVPHRDPSTPPGRGGGPPGRPNTDGTPMINGMTPDTGGPVGVDARGASPGHRRARRPTGYLTNAAPAGPGVCSAGLTLTPRPATSSSPRAWLGRPAPTVLSVSNRAWGRLGGRPPVPRPRGGPRRPHRLRDVVSRLGVPRRRPRRVASGRPAARPGSSRPRRATPRARRSPVRLVARTAATPSRGGSRETTPPRCCIAPHGLAPAGVTARRPARLEASRPAPGTRPRPTPRLVPAAGPCPPGRTAEPHRYRRSSSPPWRAAGRLPDRPPPDG